MKERWIFAGLGLVAVAYVKQEYQIIAIIMLMLLWYARYFDRTWILILLLCVIMVIEPKYNELPVSGRAKIIKVNQNYHIVEINYQKYITYDLKDVNFDDIIVYQGEYQEVSKVPCNFCFDQTKWLKSNDIKGQLKISAYNVEYQSDSIRAKLFTKILDHDNHNTKILLLRLLYQYQSDDLLNDDIVSLLGSTGTYLSSFIRLIEKGLMLFLYQGMINVIVLILLFFIGFNYGFSFLIIQLILVKLLSHIENRYDRLGLLIVILLCINPYYLFNIRFQIVILIRFIALFNSKRCFYGNALIIMIVQLINFFKTNILTVLMFSKLRHYFVMLYLLAITSLLFNRFWLFNLMSSPLWLIKLDLNHFTFTGKPSILFCFIFLTILVRIMKNRKMKDVLWLVVLLVVNQHQSLLYPFGEITFINIGQGDSALVRLPYDNQIILIDTGSFYNQNKLSSYLNALGIKKIKALLVSHPDTDHSGNVNWLCDNYKVMTVIDEKVDNFNDKRAFIQGLLTEKIYDNDNDNSQVWLFSINNLNFLFLGDISVKVEKDLIENYPDLEVDIVKLAHHGSKTSTSEQLLSSIKAKIAIISAGKNNIYRHPSSEVVDRVNNYGIKSYVTYEVGDISVYFSILGNLIHTSSGEFVIMR